MACPLCGEVCRCHLESGRAADAGRFEATRPGRQKFIVSVLEGPRVSEPMLSVAPGTDDGSTSTPKPRFEVEIADNGTSITPHPAPDGPAQLTNHQVEVCQEAIETGPLIGDCQPNLPRDESWRSEVTARLDRYRSRRKPKAPRYPSLRLSFDCPEPAWSEIAAKTATIAPQPVPPVSSAATALAPILVENREQPESEVPVGEEMPESLRVEPRALPPIQTGKIIEFPRFSWPPPQRDDELAEPVMTHPRILDVPEVAPPPPALGGILIETEKVEADEKRPGIDIPLQSAPIEKRLLATAIDGLLVLSATTLFAYIVFRLSHPKLPILQGAGLCTGLAAFLWACYQYIFVVYTGTTPGLRVMKLRLSRFDGQPVHQPLRRWRVLVSFLSAASLGMGYAWHFLDEDALCWHDRMTHTYIGPAEEHSDSKVPS